MCLLLCSDSRLRSIDSPARLEVSPPRCGAGAPAATLLLSLFPFAPAPSSGLLPAHQAPPVRHGRRRDHRRQAPTDLRSASPTVFRMSCGRSEEHTSELQSLMRISYAVFCLKKKTNNTTTHLPIYFTNADNRSHRH